MDFGAVQILADSIHRKNLSEQDFDVMPLVVLIRRLLAPPDRQKLSECVSEAMCAY